MTQVFLRHRNLSDVPVTQDGLSVTVNPVDATEKQGKAMPVTVTQARQAEEKRYGTRVFFSSMRGAQDQFLVKTRARIEKKKRVVGVAAANRAASARLPRRPRGLPRCRRGLPAGLGGVPCRNAHVLMIAVRKALDGAVEKQEPGDPRIVDMCS